MGQQLTEAPQAAAAVVEGQVPLAYAQILARARARASAPVRAALDAGGTTELLALAAVLDVATFTRRVTAWVAAHDVTAAEQTFESVRQRRFARLVDRDGGVKIDAFVDPVVGAAIRTALEAVTPVPAENDTRTPEQRVADALETLATRVLGLGADKIGAQIRPHISLIVPADTWTTIRTPRTRGTAPTGRSDQSGTAGGTGEASAPEGPGTAGTAGRAGEASTPVGPGTAGADSGADTSDGTPQRARTSDEPDPNDPPVMVLPELDDATPIPPTALERIACDCEITRIVLDADGIPLDVGRTQRTYTKELRRAILIRDRHCRWPGCTLRASWCDVHHITWYSRGGPTSIENALSLCAFHHHEVHRHDVTIVATPTGHTFQRRDGHHIGASNRRHDIHDALVPRPATPADPSKPDKDVTADNGDQQRPRPTRAAPPGCGYAPPPAAGLF